MIAPTSRIDAIRAALEKVCHQTWPSQVDYLEIGDTRAVYSLEDFGLSGVTVNLTLDLIGLDDSEETRAVGVDFDDDDTPDEIAAFILGWLHGQIEPHQSLRTAVMLEG